MKNFWKKYWEWSDKINAPFARNKERLLLYVVLAQTVIVTVGLLNLFKTTERDLIMVCRPLNFNDTICVQAEVSE